MRTGVTRVVVGVVVGLLLTTPGVWGQGSTDREHWVGTWATALVGQTPPSAGAPPGAPTVPGLANHTLRQIVHVSLGGERVRVVLSNAFGSAPLEVGAAHVARRAQGSTIDPGGRRLTFGGRGATTIPAGAVVFSDPVDLSVPPLTDLAIDLHLPGDPTTAGSPITMHTGASQTSFVSATGDHTGALELPDATEVPSWLFLARVEVTAPPGTGAVVLLGDSITDGTGSTSDTNNRWPDHLARRLQAEGISMGVLNLGIAGNRVLTDGAGVSALARFDRDVLAQTGVTHLVVLEGINDIGLARNDLGLPRPDEPPTAEDVIFAHGQLIARARAHGLTVIGATLTPFEGTAIPVIPDYWTAEGEETRQAVNAWLRTSGAYDALVDFDALVRDPAQPGRFLPRYDSGDHLHPGDAGYRAMAEGFDLSLLTEGVAAGVR